MLIFSLRFCGNVWVRWSVIKHLLLFLAAFLGGAPHTWADDVFVHALSLHGIPHYRDGFTHFSYANPQAPKGGELKLASIGTFDTLNPFTLKGVAAEGAGQTFETLMTQSYDEPFSIYCWVCEGVSVASDRTSMTFQLRAEAKFSDGSPITADDVVTTFDKLKTEGHPFYRSYYRDVSRVEKLSPQRVRFTFANGDNAELPLIVGQLPVLSKKDLSARTFGDTTLSPLLGSGPYKISGMDVGRSLVLTRDATWWAKDLPINKGRYNFETIRYDYYRDATVALEALFAGRYDVRLENIAKNWATGYDAPQVKSGQIVKREFMNGNPSGMQGYVFNLRRPVFEDRAVREAIGLAFDFEWSNKNIAFGAYTRTNSYFENSDLGAIGLPTEAELALLEPFRAQLPPEVFTQEYMPPKTDGSGEPRENLRKAAQLLRDAGWLPEMGVLKKGDKFLAFEILVDSPSFERWTLPFIRNLQRLGIQTQLRVVDSAQYQARINDFDFDMTVTVFPQSLSPGNEQRDFWTSAKADVKGSRNLAGIKNPVVDALVDKLVAAKSRDELTVYTRALDRVLLWNYYVVPHWHVGVHRVAFWDKFGMPGVTPPYALGITDLWWAKDTSATQPAATAQ
ncbi:MAG: ABC transporter substrate-binding protein [Alphaproteobacteria bacterium]|nr:ABC transporter substrate-binding protein [Alphaproteobacteria bacterium]